MRVAIVGAGYGGLHALWSLQRELGKSAQVTIINPRSFHTYHGWTGEVLSGLLSGRDTFSPIEPLLGEAEFIKGTVTALDLPNNTIRLVSPDGSEREVGYDHVLLAHGSKDPLDRIPGSRQHAFRLKSIDDLLDLESFLKNLDDRTLSKSITERITLAVVGAGFSGVESASSIARRYALHRELIEVCLIASPEGVLPKIRSEFPKMVASTEESLNHAGVRILRKGRVTEVTESEVVFADGFHLPCNKVIITAGILIDPIPGTEALAGLDGRIEVDRFLSSPAGKNVWAVGDAASVPIASGDGHCPAAAIWAMRQGNVAGTNIARAIQGRSRKEFRFKGFGQAAGLGNGSAVAELYGVQLKGRPAALIRLAFFLWYMPCRRAAWNVLRKTLKRPQRRPQNELTTEPS